MNFNIETNNFFPGEAPKERPKTWESEEYLEGQKKWVFSMLKDAGLNFEDFESEGEQIGESYTDDVKEGHLVHFAVGVIKGNYELQIKLHKNGSYYVGWVTEDGQGSTEDYLGMKEKIQEFKNL